MKILKSRNIVSHLSNAVVVKKCVYFTVILSILSTGFILNLMINESQPMYKDHHVKFPTDLKYILFWRLETNRKGYYFKKLPDLLEGQAMFINQKCKYINCFITYNNSILHGNSKNFDAVVFNIKEIFDVKREEIELTRSPEQKYIFNSMDSAAIFPVCFPYLDNFFNLTWTYRFDSDIPQPFFDIYDYNNNLVGPKQQMNWIIDMKHTNRYKNVIHNKTKAVAWIVNKCRSRRKHFQLVTDIGRELNSYNYSLDLYGKCGGTKCPGDNILSCYEIIEKSYYFQLVLEDTTSEDHVTERMGRAMMQTAIPIVQGGLEYASYLPPGSYINMKNLTIKELGAIIDYLIHNPKYYAYFFDWKSYYYYTIRPKDYVCDLCAYLNEDIGHSKKTYKKFRKWWNSAFHKHCQQKRLFDLFIDFQ
ncbi:unnamed protein product [Parnassius mnemosyne]|uniref:Fucosyltransferase n=1 Tax=Parnassius mnemosyne TaxID=213953 RepID=A0AAV1L3T4_9NEOP